MTEKTEPVSRTNEGPAFTSKIKACLFTLIIYTCETRRIEYFQNLVQMVMEKFPCKIIFIRADPTQGSDCFQIQSKSVTIGKGDQMITCDQINILTSPKNIEKIPFVILPNLVPDLPVYLIWGQDPVADNKLLKTLQNLSTRTIFDSETSENLSLFCKQMLAQIDHTKNNVVDMNWVKMGAWRNVMCQTFDTKERIEQLTHANKMVISYNGVPSPALHHHEIQAVYLQAWIASRLNWKLKHVDGSESLTSITYINDLNKEVKVELVSKNDEFFLPAMLLSIEITNGDLNFTIKRMQKLAQVEVHISKAETCELPFTIPLPNLQKGVAFLKELFYSSLSSHYARMLRAL